MGERLKPDTHLSMTQEWFAEIWNGKKNIEYRKVCPRYKRFAKWVCDDRPRFIMLYIGMMPTGPRLLIQVKKTEIGPCPIPGFNGPHYCIHFDVVQPYMFDHGTYFPMMNMPKMKKGGKGKKK